MRKNKIVVLLLLVAIMVLSAALVACVPIEEPHVCGHVCETCKKCTDSTCTNSVCADKCQGHEEPEHEKCPNCEGCLDLSCTKCEYTCECIITDAQALANAVQAIKIDYKDIKSIATSTDFSATRSIDGYEEDRTTRKTFTVSVAWTVEIVSGVEGAVSLELNEEKEVYTLSIDYPKNTGSTINLTAVVTCGSETQNWVLENVSVPKMDTVTVADFLGKEENEETIYAVQGWAVASGASKNDNGENKASFVIADSTGAVFSYNKYYVEVGKKYTVYGTRSSSNGTPQIGTIGITPVETEETFVEPTATELAASDINLSELSKDTIGNYTGKYYKITGSFAAKSGSYVNANYNKKQLLSLYMSDTMKKAAEAMDGKQIIVYGYVRGCSTGNYLTIQVSKIELDPNGGTDEGGEGGEEDSAAKTAYLESVVKTPVADTEYKLAMWQNNKGEVYYATGAISGRYLSTTTDASKAAIVTVVAAQGGYYIKIGDKYLTITGEEYNNKLSTSSPTLTDAATTVFTIDANGVLVFTASATGYADGTFYLGSYGDFTTISANATSYISDTTKIDVSQYVARLVAVDASSEGGEGSDSGSAGTDTPAGPITTIADAVNASEGATVQLSGTVSDITEAWSSYNNMSFYISDGTKKILVYRAGTKVVVGDIVSVSGTITIYSQKAQIAQGATVTVTTAHVCSSWTTATCEDASVCTTCGAEKVEALGHVDENNDNICDRDDCGWNMSAVKKSLTITGSTGTMGTKEITWTNDIVTVKNEQASSTTAIRNSDNDHFRAYTNSKLTISISSGTLVRIVVTCQSDNYATALKNSLTTTGATATVSGTTVVITVTGDISAVEFSMAEQSRITGVEVVYIAAE